MDHPELKNAPQTEAERVLDYNKGVMASLETEADGISLIMAWVVGLACVLAGYILGNLLPFHGVHS